VVPSRREPLKGTERCEKFRPSGTESSAGTPSSRDAHEVDPSGSSELALKAAKFVVKRARHYARGKSQKVGPDLLAREAETLVSVIHPWKEYE
jgi:hypothetical protein